MAARTQSRIYKNDVLKVLKQKIRKSTSVSSLIFIESADR